MARPALSGTPLACIDPRIMAEETTARHLLPFGGASIVRARLNMFAKSCRIPTVLVGRDHCSGLPPLLTLMHPADLYVMLRKLISQT